MKNIPQELKNELNSNIELQNKWNELTDIARRDFISWIISAKQKKTYEHRIKRAKDMILSNKKRPCCVTIIPREIYTMLLLNPCAQLIWKKCTPHEKRDFTDWLNKGSTKEIQIERLQKIRDTLLHGQTKI